jgi:hypothetical protein
MTTPTVSTGASDALLLALTDAIRSATGPDIQAAQALLLRRLATEGDVIPSRIPAAKNVTEAAGWYNLLTDLGETEMRREMLASVLGLASSPFTDEGGAAAPPMRFTSIPNDRPLGPGGASVPLTVTARSDLAAGLQTALSTVHADGGILPLWSPLMALPPASTALPDPMPYLGRAVWLAPTAALSDPTTDPLVLGRTTTDPGAGYRVGVRVGAGTAAAAVLDWTGLVFDTIGNAFVAREIGTVGLLPIDAALTGTPFVAHPIAAAPSSRADLSWARLVAVAGLVPGVSRLEDELAVLWSSDAIAASAFATHVNAVWNGTAFA